MSRDYPKKTNESTWNPMGTFTGTTGSARESYKKGFSSANGETQMEKRPAPLGAPAVENQPRQYTKGANPLMPTPTKQSLVPHFAKGGKVAGATTKDNPNKAAPAGGAQMPGGMPSMGGGDAGGMGVPTSGALGGMAPPVGGALPAGGGGMPGGMPDGAGKPPGYGGGPPAPGAIQANGSQVSQVAKGGKGGGHGGRNPAGNPMQRSLAADGGGGGADGFDPGLGDFNGPAMGSFEATNPQTSADSMHSGWDMSGMNQWQDFGQDMRNQLGTGMGTPTPMTPGIGGAGFTTFDPAMRGGGFSTGGSFGSDASGGFSESGPSTNPGGGWGGESHFARGGPVKKTPKNVGGFSKDSGGSTDSMGGGGGMTPPTPTVDDFGDSTLPGGYGGGYAPGSSMPNGTGFGPKGVADGTPVNQFGQVGNLYDYRGQAPMGGAGTATVTKGPSAGLTRPVAPGFSTPTAPRAPAPSGGGSSPGLSNQMDYGNFNNSGYGNYDFGLNPNMAGRTFDDNYGGNNPNDTGGGGNSSGGGYSGGSGGFGGADQESKG